MNVRDLELELVVLGMVIQNPELLKSLVTRPNGVLADLQLGSIVKLKQVLGPNVAIGSGFTAANVIAEWNRLMAHEERVRVAHQQLRMAQLGA